MAVWGLYRTFVTHLPSRGYWHTLVILLHGRPKLDCMAAWMYFSSFRKPHHVRCGGIELQFWWLDPTLMINKVVMLLRVDTRPRYHPRAMHEITNLLRVFVAQLAKLLLEFCWQKFLLHPRHTNRDFVPGTTAVECWDTTTELLGNTEIWRCKTQPE